MGSHEVQLRNEKTTLKIVFFKHIFHVGVKFVSRIKEHLPQVMQKIASTVKFNYEKFIESHIFYLVFHRVLLISRYSLLEF